jgi:hypothetical protein
MTEGAMDPTSIGVQLANLERQVRRLKRLTVLLSAIVLALFLPCVSLLVWQYARPRSRTVEAERFELRDERRVYARLRIEQDRPVLAFNGPEGQPVLSLGVGQEGPSVLLRDSNLRPRAFLNVNQQSPLFRLFDENGKARVELGMREKGLPYLVLTEENERPCVALREEGGASSISFVDPQTKARTALGVTQEEGPALMLFDTRGERRVSLLVDKGVGASLLLLDKNKIARVGALSPDKGVTGFFVYDTGQRIRAALTIAEDRPLLRIVDEAGTVLFSKP